MHFPDGMARAFRPLQLIRRTESGSSRARARARLQITQSPAKVVRGTVSLQWNLSASEIHFLVHLHAW
jgi:hypothetical protein